MHDHLLTLNDYDNLLVILGHDVLLRKKKCKKIIKNFAKSVMEKKLFCIKNSKQSAHTQILREKSCEIFTY